MFSKDSWGNAIAGSLPGVTICQMVEYAEAISSKLVMKGVACIYDGLISAHNEICILILCIGSYFNYLQRLILNLPLLF